jgi:hypothetical protein
MVVVAIGLPILTEVAVVVPNAKPAAESTRAVPTERNETALVVFSVWLNGLPATGAAQEATPAPFVVRTQPFVAVIVGRV